MLRTINGKKVEIAQEVLEEIRARCDSVEGSTFKELFKILEKRSGITVDHERADELYMMHVVNDILSAIGGKGEKKTIFSGISEDGERRNWSLKVLPEGILTKILEAYEKTLEKLNGKIEAIRRQIVEIRGLLSTRPLLEDDTNPEEILADMNKKKKAG